MVGSGGQTSHRAGGLHYLKCVFSGFAEALASRTVRMWKLIILLVRGT